MPRHPSAGTAAESSHLSIGEVLGLLLEEFPDVTISKIRFLESQGLIAPERTPSGYRKFFDNDVELLRVILREQRENYLPLRVIKDRITSGELDASGENTMPRGIRNVSTPSDTGHDPRHDDTQPAGLPPTIGNHHTEPTSNDTEASPGDRDPTGFDTAPLPTIAPRGPAQPSEPPVSGAQPTPEVPSNTARADDDTAPAGAPDGRGAATPAAAEDSGNPDEPVPEVAAPTERPITRDEEQTQMGSQDSPPPPAAAGGPSHPGGEPEQPAPSHAAAASAAEGGATSGSDPQLLPGVTLNIDELSAMVGGTPAEIRQLEEYGIVTGRDSAGEHVYDDDAVTVARIAVQFLHLGIDARHLRGWKTAVDREAGLYEQLIMPLLRQRNPQGRQQASEQLRRMNELGAELRAALMSIALRELDRG